MAHVNCPNCGKRLRFSDTSDPVRIRCPICKHTFRATAGSALTSQTLPASQSPGASDYSEAGLGWFAKTSIIVMAMAGIALLAFLVYKVASTGRPDQKENPPHEIVRAKTDRPKSTAISPEKLFAKTSPAVVRIVARDGRFNLIGMGSGFFISEDGLLITNYHVIEKADFITVLLNNKETLFVDGVAAVDTKADLALLKVNGQILPRLNVATEQPPKVGAKVYAIGNPQGLTNTLSEGMVSGLRKINEGLTLIQTTAPISKGSSGGPLLTLNGKVVGVTTFYFRRGQNLNFAVPAEKIAALLENRGKVQTLASAGGKRLDKTATQELDKAWVAVAKKDRRTAAQILTRLRKTQKDNPVVLFTVGKLYERLSSGSNGIALSCYKEAITLKPNFAEAYYSIGFINASQAALIARATKYGLPVPRAIVGSNAEAIAAYKKAIAIKPDFAEAYCDMGVTYDHMGRYTEAIVAYKKAITLKSDFATAYYNMGGAYRALKRYTEAIAAYKKVIALKPDFAAAYYNMGVAYGALKRYIEEIAAYKKAIAIKPDFAEEYSDIGAMFRRMAHYTEAPVVSKIEAYWSMGHAYRALKRFPEAIAAYKKAIAVNPNYAKSYFLMGSTYYELKRYTEAIAAYKKAIAIKPDYATYWFLGSVYEDLKRYEDAIAAYKKAIALRPNDANAYCSMGHAYHELKRYPEAIAAYKKAIAIKPDDAEVYCFMGVAYRALKRYPEAIAAYKKAIAIKPDDAAAYWFMGSAYHALKRYPEAIAAYKKAIAINPDDADAYCDMGHAYYTLKRYTEADAACSKAIMLNPNGEIGREARKIRALIRRSRRE